MQLWQVYRHAVPRIPEPTKLALRRQAPAYFALVKTKKDPVVVHGAARDIVRARFPGISAGESMDFVLYLIGYVSMHVDPGTGELDGVVARDQMSDDKDAMSEINAMDSLMLRDGETERVPLAKALYEVLSSFGQTSTGLLREGHLPFA